MGKFIKFWGRCAKDAFFGNSSFANSWQWVFGNPVASILGTVWATARGVRAMTTGSDIFDTFLAALAAFAVTWLVVFFIRLISLPSKYYNEEKEKVDTLEKQLTPRISAIFDSRTPSCRSAETFTFSDGRNSMDAIVYRIEVENTSEATITNCEGYLTEVAFEEEPAQLGSMSLTWSGKYPPEIKIDLRPRVKRYLDLLVINRDKQVTIMTPGWPPNNKQNFFLRIGVYRFAVVMVGDKSAALPLYKLRLNYTGDWQTSTMEPM